MPARAGQGLSGLLLGRGLLRNWDTRSRPHTGPDSQPHDRRHQHPDTRRRQASRSRLDAATESTVMILSKVEDWGLTSLVGHGPFVGGLLKRGGGHRVVRSRPLIAVAEQMRPRTCDADDALIAALGPPSFGRVPPRLGDVQESTDAVPWCGENKSEHHRFHRRATRRSWWRVRAGGPSPTPHKGGAVLPGKGGAKTGSPSW